MHFGQGLAEAKWDRPETQGRQKASVGTVGAER